jgi:hypothetical protein
MKLLAKADGQTSEFPFPQTPTPPDSNGSLPNPNLELLSFSHFSPDQVEDSSFPRNRT